MRPVFTKAFLKKLERRGRGKVNQVRGTVAVGGAEAGDKDSPPRHPPNGAAPKAFQWLLAKRIPHLNYLGRAEEIIDMPAQPLFPS